MFLFVCDPPISMKRKKYAVTLGQAQIEGIWIWVIAIILNNKIRKENFQSLVLCCGGSKSALGNWSLVYIGPN